MFNPGLNDTWPVYQGRSLKSSTHQQHITTLTSTPTEPPFNTHPQKLAVKLETDPKIWHYSTQESDKISHFKEEESWQGEVGERHQKMLGISLKPWLQNSGIKIEATGLIGPDVTETGGAKKNEGVADHHNWQLNLYTTLGILYTCIFVL